MVVAAAEAAAVLVVVFILVVAEIGVSYEPTVCVGVYVHVCFAFFGRQLGAQTGVFRVVLSCEPCSCPCTAASLCGVFVVEGLLALGFGLWGTRATRVLEGFVRFVRVFVEFERGISGFRLGFQGWGS